MGVSSLPKIKRFPELGLGWVEISKNGSSSISRMIVDAGLRAKPADRLTKSEAGQDRDTLFVAMLRDPYDRLASVYRMWSRPHFNGRSNLPYSDFVRFWLRTPPGFDQCVCPQSEYLPNVEKLRLVRWDFREFADLFGFRDISHENSTGGVNPEMDADAQALFEDYYGEDLRIWRNE